jgi:hypothetical protein
MNQDDDTEDDIEEDSIDEYFRCLHTDGRWAFEVALVAWESPHEPSLEWNTFRTWKKEPSAERLLAARTAATKRYFRTCIHCQELCNLGHMHDRSICQCCASCLLGIVH